MAVKKFEISKNTKKKLSDEEFCQKTFAWWEFSKLKEFMEIWRKFTLALPKILKAYEIEFF